MTDPRQHKTYLDDLRLLIFGEFTTRSWAQLLTLMSQIGITWSDHESLGKDKYVTRELKLASPAQLGQIARWFVVHSDQTRRKADFEDAVAWIEAGGEKAITDITRQRLLFELEGRDLVGQLSLDEFAKLVGRDPGNQQTQYIKDSSGIHSYNIFEQFFHQQPVPGQLADNLPMTNREFLTSWGLLTWPDKRVMAFIEALVAPTVRTADAQLQWAKLLIDILRPDGFALDCMEYISGRPVYRVIHTASRLTSRPKNIIFASNGPKPELGLSDAIHNDIVVLQNANFCLIYDEPISDDGLLWSELVSWWMKRQNLNEHEVAAKDLGSRLLQSLDSEAEKIFFRTYFRDIKPLLDDRLPALLPQVYLHYDPKTLVQLRNNKRLPRQRMDFLLLLPERSRIVLEVDGKHHYCNDGGFGDPMRYAEMVREDRALRLFGYEVYRFGGDEFTHLETARASIATFFRKLLEKHRLLKE